MPATSRQATTRRRVVARRALNLVIAIVAPATVGVATLLAEDLLPRPDAQFGSTPGRWVAILACSVVLGTAIVWRGWLATKRGTLYYVSLLDDAMPDLHLERIREVQRGMLGFRSITRSVDCLDTMVVDLRHTVHELSQEFERACNDDDTTTGYDVAPNMLAPAAIAFGYDWLPPSRVQLCEYNNPRDPARPEPDFCWRMESLDAEDTGGIGVHRVQPPDVDAAKVKWVLIDVYLTPRNIPTVDWRAVHRPDFPCEVRFIVGIVSDHCLQPVLVATGRSSRAGKEQKVGPRQCVEAVSMAIREAFTEFPGAVVVLVTQMPKSVAVGVGWQLAKDSKVKDSRTRHPWRLLVPLAYIPPPEGQPAPALRPAWVRFDQPDPAALLASVGAWSPR